MTSARPWRRLPQRPAFFFRATGVLAQAYPSKPITWMVPFTPGGITDGGARIIAKALNERIGQPVLALQSHNISMTTARFDRPAGQKTNSPPSSTRR